MKEPMRFEAYFKEQVEERYRAQADFIIELAKDSMTRPPMPHKKQQEVDKIKRLDNVQRYDFVVPQRHAITESVSIADALPAQLQLGKTSTNQFKNREIMLRRQDFIEKILQKN